MWNTNVIMSWSFDEAVEKCSLPEFLKPASEQAPSNNLFYSDALITFRSNIRCSSTYKYKWDLRTSATKDRFWANLWNTLILSLCMFDHSVQYDAALYDKLTADARIFNAFWCTFPWLLEFFKNQPRGFSDGLGLKFYHLGRLYKFYNLVYTVHIHT